MRNQALRIKMSKAQNNNFANGEEFLATLRLARSNGIGAATFFKLLDKFQSPTNIIASASQILAARNIKISLEQNVLEEIKDTKKIGGHIISIFDEKYPALLKEIPNPPIIISYFGDISKVTINSIAIVGSRFASANSVTLSYKFSKDLTDNNFTTVSGLARGIDTGVHKGSLDAENKLNILPTIAVIAGGLDNIYPKENEQLFYSLKENALIITENQIGVKPKSENFPRRNRIISGLSQGTLVVEAAIKSGSLITARYASEQGRDVMAVPGFPLDKKSEGTNKLIKNGAALITNISDIIALTEFNSTQKIKQQNLFKESDVVPLNEYDSENKQEGQDTQNASEIILNKISTSPIHIEDIASQTKLNIQTINSLLLEYELEEKIIREPGGKVALKA